MNTEVILHETRIVPAIGVSDHRSILRQGTWKSEFEVGQGTLAHHAIEGEDTVVVQQGLLNVFGEREFAAKLERVASVGVTESATPGIKIPARSTPGNR